MGGLIPLSDASRRPAHFPIITICIILANACVFSLELKGGDAFVLQWSAIPANIMAGQRWITVLTAMFLHGSWSHILSNMVFQPEFHTSQPGCEWGNCRSHGSIPGDLSWR
jgi:membrane associated rhomboid family serine protease